jgi:ketosteroid isomerase-like protein
MPIYKMVGDVKEAFCLKRVCGHGLKLILMLVVLLAVSGRVGASPVIDRNAGSNGLIPDLFVSMPTGEEPAYALVVEKNSQQITLFKYDGTYQAVETMKCSTGKARGDKMVSGDKKTPEGAYFFTQEFSDEDLAPLYGTRAFPIDYPNLIDRRQGRNGYAIWMHGTNRPLKDRDSNGCIALINRDIDKLSAYIALKDTPILIAQKIGYKPYEQAVSEDSAIRSFLADWNQALASGTYHDYLAFYDSGYLPDISWWMPWLESRKADPSIAAAVDARIAYLGIYKHRDLFVAMFDQRLTVGALEEVVGRRKIFISYASGNPRIVGDTFILPGNGDQPAPAVYPLVLAAQSLWSRHSGEEAIAGLVERWLAAWSGKDIQAYGACYSKHFRSRQMDWQMWVAYKERLNKTYSFIQVTGENIKIVRNQDTATVTLFQTYASNVHRAKGIKTLRLRLEDGKWKIFRETFKKK